MIPQWLSELTTVCAGWEISVIEDQQKAVCYPVDGASIWLSCTPERTFAVRVLIPGHEITTITDEFLPASDAVRELVRLGWRGL